MSEEKLIRTAEFNPKVCTYWLLSGALIMTLTLVGIPLLVLWFPIGLVLTRRYLQRMSCDLTNKALKVRKGVIVRIEKTIPLDKITDMGMIQGPLMRLFGLEKLTVETAGQSGQGALVSLTGIVEAQAFREAVLFQRELMVADASLPSAPAEILPRDASDNAGDTLLLEIRDALFRIEASIKPKKGGPNKADKAST